MRGVAWLLALVYVTPLSSGAISRPIGEVSLAPSEISRPIGEFALEPSEVSRPIGEVAVPPSPPVPAAAVSVEPEAGFVPGRSGSSGVRTGGPVWAVPLPPSPISRPIGAVSLPPSAVSRPIGAVSLPPSALARDP